MNKSAANIIKMRRKTMSKNINQAENTSILFVGNIANNSYNNVKFIREFGKQADVLMYDYVDLMGQPEWEDAIIKPKNGAVINSIEDCIAEDFLLPDWFHRVKSNDFWFYRTKSKLYRKIHPIISKWLYDRNINNKSINQIIKDFDHYFIDKIHKTSINRNELYSYYCSAFTMERMYGDYKYLVLCDTNPIWGLFQDRPYIAFEHGTLRDFPFEDTTQGKLLALAYKKARKVVITNVDNIEAARKLELTNTCFIPHPVDTAKYKPVETSLRQDLLNKYQVDSLIFSPSRHNWCYEQSKGLSVYKGNDKMIKAMVEVKRHGLKTKLIFCDWGQEQHLSKQLIKDLELQNEVVWISPLSKRELAEYYNACDIVLDQFTIGTFGTNCIEAMACAKPVFIYLRPEIHNWAFKEMPPVVNVEESDEIANRLIQMLKNPELGKQLGQEALRWIRMYHSKEIVANLWLNLLSTEFEDNSMNSINGRWPLKNRQKGKLVKV